MNKYESFVKLFAQLMNNSKEPVVLTEEQEAVFEELRVRATAEEKPLVTESGALILGYLQNNDVKMTSSEIAKGMRVSVRKVTGAIRKLVDDNFICRVGISPVVYSLTDKGRNFNLQDYKGE